jgi:hypothetical protein
LPVAIPSAARQLGVATSYDELHAILRRRADELEVSRLTLDFAGGLTSAHSSKLLSNPPLRRLGPTSLALMLGALGVALVVVEDKEALARIGASL